MSTPGGSHGSRYEGCRFQLVCARLKNGVSCPMGGGCLDKKGFLTQDAIVFVGRMRATIVEGLAAYEKTGFSQVSGMMPVMNKD